MGILRARCDLQRAFFGHNKNKEQNLKTLHRFYTGVVSDFTPNCYDGDVT